MLAGFEMSVRRRVEQLAMLIQHINHNPARLGQSKSDGGETAERVREVAHSNAVRCAGAVRAADGRFENGQNVVLFKQEVFGVFDAKSVLQRTGVYRAEVVLHKEVI